VQCRAWFITPRPSVNLVLDQAFVADSRSGSGSGNGSGSECDPAAETSSRHECEVELQQKMNELEEDAQGVKEKLFALQKALMEASEEPKAEHERNLVEQVGLAWHCRQHIFESSSF
jgi:hypothetical protein